ncbi:glucan 1,6-alpha-glucosidase [Vibrio maritimus]|uniref:Glucan 1,6-alpha-glucosidase n=1 Tax=Vibrio maritimus TaxID=990268 RepID=A0A090SZY1_9VIBR|nr:glucan 1,6-alpha-glucosidase [Vibrio maritimus]
MYRYYQSLIALRKRYRAIVHGDFTPVLEQHDKVFAYLRTEGETRLMVVANFSGEFLKIDLSEFNQNAAEVLLSNSGRTTFDFSEEIELQPYDAYMVKLTS